MLPASTLSPQDLSISQGLLRAVSEIVPPVPSLHPIVPAVSIIISLIISVWLLALMATFPSISNVLLVVHLVLLVNLPLLLVYLA